MIFATLAGPLAAIIVLFLGLYDELLAMLAAPASAALAPSLIRAGFSRFLLDIRVFQNCVLVLEGLVGIKGRCCVDADCHVKLQHCEESDSKPKWDCDGVVLVRDIVDSKLI